MSDWDKYADHEIGLITKLIIYLTCGLICASQYFMNKRTIEITGYSIASLSSAASLQLVVIPVGVLLIIALLFSCEQIGKFLIFLSNEKDEIDLNEFKIVKFIKKIFK